MSAGKDKAVHYWWERAWQSLEAGRRDFQAEAYPFAVNRLYYAAFYAVSALLLKESHSFSKHSGVRAAFHQHFIKRGKIEKEWGRFYDHLFEDRHEGDYVEFVTFDKSYVEDQMVRIEQFLNRVQALIKT
ncbi:HEPN domain-containing protein [Acidobacteria bacterium AH-259-O06]|nr:HEPN domain-containing protein [Acidobacteria bacterium AH-259-O06]